MRHLYDNFFLAPSAPHFAPPNFFFVALEFGWWEGVESNEFFFLAK